MSEVREQEKQVDGRVDEIPRGGHSTGLDDLRQIREDREEDQKSYI
jgi:hypothetical protein